MIITLVYDSDPYWNGITVGTLAHEMGHAIHFMAEVDKGSKRLERDFLEMNGSFAYVGAHYGRLWNEKKHSMAFAYDYGMSEIYEDIATIIELLAEDPDGMRIRLNDPQNAILRQKTEFIRQMAFNTVSNECYALFAPLEQLQTAKPVIYMVSAFLIEPFYKY